LARRAAAVAVVYEFCVCQPYEVLHNASVKQDLDLRDRQVSKTENQPSDDNARLRAVLDAAVDGIITIDERGTVEAVNPAAEKLFGYASSEMIGHNVNMLMPSPYHEEHDGYLSNYVRTGKRKIIGIGREAEGRRKDGTTFPLYLAVSEVSFGHRRVFTGFVHDLTELKQAEEEATQLGRILEDSLNEIFIFDAQSLRFVFVNRGALANVGYTAAELFGMTPVDIKPEFTQQQFQELVTPLTSGQKSELQFDTVHERKDGSRYNTHIRLQRATWKGRTSLVAIILDVTEQIRTSEELAQRDAQLEFMVDHLPGAAAYVDQQTRAVQFNRMVEDITGYSPEDLTDVDTCFRLLFGRDAAAIHQDYESHQKSAGTEPFRQTIRRKDGASRVVEFRGYGYDDHQVWLLHDVTDRDRHETELRIRDRAIQAANEGVVIADATREGYPIVFVNEAFEELTGYPVEEAIGRSCDILCGCDPDSETLSQLKSAVSDGKDFRTTIPCVRKNGNRYWNELSIAAVHAKDGTLTHVVAVMEDVSNRLNSEQKLLQSERLAAIGQMVTGLAHESRNALQRAQACLDMLSLDLEDQPEQLELTEKTRRALTDLHRYYEEVRNYAAPINLECRATDLSRIWERSWADLEANRFGRDFQLEVDDTQCSVTCFVDEHRLEQVFRNIIENAMAACPDPGRLRISCCEIELDDARAVRISFQDNGPGFNNETAEAVFQPFFTTKQKGTGLGMPICKRIIEAHGGRICVGDSTAGAEIVIELPCG